MEKAAFDFGNMQKLLYGSSRSAEDARKQGNHFFRKGEFFDALKCYNESLMLAKRDTPDIAMAYANRSAVYLEVKLYNICSDNIDLARRSGYPDHLMSKLDEREEKCKKLMKDHKPDPNEFFKLSYSANKKIPFIVHCLEFRQDGPSGPGVYTTRDLNPGDIIAIEDPIQKRINEHAMKFRCYHCLKSNKMNLFLYGKYLFCSELCKESFSKTFKNVGANMNLISKMLNFAVESCDGDFNKLKNLMDDPDLAKKTIFDYDFSTNDSLSYLRAFLGDYIKKFNSQKAEIPDKQLHNFHIVKELKTEREKRIACRFMKKVVEVPLSCLAKTDTADPEVIGHGILFFEPLLYHSCDPNIYKMGFDGKVAYYVETFIQKDQRLFMSVDSLFSYTPKAERRKNFRENFGINCTCVACVNNWPVTSPNEKDQMLKLYTQWLFVNREHDEANFNTICEKMHELNQKRGSAHPCQDEIGFKRIMYDLLLRIAKSEPNIF